MSIARDRSVQSSNDPQPPTNPPNQPVTSQTIAIDSSINANDDPPVTSQTIAIDSSINANDDPPDDTSSTLLSLSATEDFNLNSNPPSNFDQQLQNASTEISSTNPDQQLQNLTTENSTSNFDPQNQVSNTDQPLLQALSLLTRNIAEMSTKMDTLTDIVISTSTAPAKSSSPSLPLTDQHQPLNTTLPAPAKSSPLPDQHQPLPHTSNASDNSPTTTLPHPPQPSNRPLATTNTSTPPSPYQFSAHHSIREETSFDLRQEQSSNSTDDLSQILKDVHIETTNPPTQQPPSPISNVSSTNPKNTFRGLPIDMKDPPQILQPDPNSFTRQKRVQQNRPQSTYPHTHHPNRQFLSTVQSTSAQPQPQNEIPPPTSNQHPTTPHLRNYAEYEAHTVQQTATAPPPHSEFFKLINPQLQSPTQQSPFEIPNFQGYNTSNQPSPNNEPTPPQHQHHNNGRPPPTPYDNQDPKALLQLKFGPTARFKTDKFILTHQLRSDDVLDIEVFVNEIIKGIILCGGPGPSLLPKYDRLVPNFSFRNYWFCPHFGPLDEQAERKRHEFYNSISIILESYLRSHKTINSSRAPRSYGFILTSNTITCGVDLLEQFIKYTNPKFGAIIPHLNLDKQLVLLQVKNNSTLNEVTTRFSRILRRFQLTRLTPPLSTIVKKFLEELTRCPRLSPQVSAMLNYTNIHIASNNNDTHFALTIPTIKAYLENVGIQPHEPLEFLSPSLSTPYTRNERSQNTIANLQEVQDTDSIISSSSSISSHSSTHSTTSSNKIAAVIDHHQRQPHYQSTNSKQKTIRKSNKKSSLIPHPNELRKRNQEELLAKKNNKTSQSSSSSKIPKSINLSTKKQINSLRLQEYTFYSDDESDNSSITSSINHHTSTCEKSQLSNQEEMLELFGPGFNPNTQSPTIASIHQPSSDEDEPHDSVIFEPFTIASSMTQQNQPNPTTPRLLSSQTDMPPSLSIPTSTKSPKQWRHLSS